jgi:hypothetical protein
LVHAEAEERDGRWLAVGIVAAFELLERLMTAARGISRPAQERLLAKPSFDRSVQ